MENAEDNAKRYNQAFVKVLSISEDKLTNDLEYNSVPEWDSLGHMSLMAQLESVFGISMETDDIINFSTFGKGKEILKKYNIDL
jgi:acyl carrier protein